MFNKFRAGSAFSRKRPAAVPASPVQQRADVKAMAASTPKGSPVAPGGAAQAAAMKQFNQSQQAAMQQFNAPTAALQAAQQRSNPNMSIPMETIRAAPAQAQRTGVAPAASQSQIAKDITAQNDAKANAMMMQASMDAQQRFNQKQAQKAKATPAPMTQVPSPPPFRKGGAVKKKTGYAKGGAVMCGASMPPAQKRKK